jgi:HlyD family secretion protein
MSNPLQFRRKCLPQVSSPDEINRLLEVTTAKGWIALVGIAALIVVALSWSLTAAVPLTVNGRGMLLKSGGIVEVSAGANGRLADLSVAVGDMVAEGQIIARVDQPKLSEELQVARLQLGHRRTEQQALLGASSRQVSLQMAYFDQQAEHRRQSLAALGNEIKWVTELSATQQKLVDDGRLTRQTLVTTLQRLGAANERIGGIQSELTQLGVQRQQFQAVHDREIQSSLSILQRAEQDVAQLERALVLATEVRSSSTGRVVEVVVERGTLITAGQQLLMLDLAGRTVAGLEGVIYIPARDGKRVRPGMTVLLAPATVRPEEYGYLLGRVTQVSSLPATAAGMMRILKNQAMVTELAGGGAPHEIHLDLLPDDTTVSRYRWSSARGPAIELQSGTLASAMVTVESRRPIELVMPFLRAVER